MTPYEALILAAGAHEFAITDDARQALPRAALEYARSVGWLDPQQADRLRQSMAEYAAVFETDRGDRERIERARTRVTSACEELAVALKLLGK